MFRGKQRSSELTSDGLDLLNSVSLAEKINARMALV